jgi:Domain of unknown function (DUF4234)
MAREVEIAGTQERAKIRSPWAPALLPFVTLGIYYFVWYYKINREMRDLGQARGSDELGDSPGKSLLAVTLGALIIVPAILSLIHTGQRIQAAQRLAGRDQIMSGWLSLVLYIVIAPAMFAYWQSELNKVWERMGRDPQLTEGEAARAQAGAGFGPGATTPSQMASDAPGGGGQPGSAATVPGGTEPIAPDATPPEETPPPTTPPPENEPPGS